MRTRIISGLTLTALLLAGLFFGGWAFRLLLVLVSVLAVYEVQKMFRSADIEPVAFPVYCFISAFCCLIGYLPTDVLFAAWAVLLLAYLAISIFGNRSMPDLLASLYICVYPTIFLCSIAFNYFGMERSVSFTASILTFASPSICDTFAYFGGTLMGKRKLCPGISPKKTVAGSIFALLGGIVSSIVLIYLQHFWQSTIGSSLLLFAGLMIGIFSQLGDLYASKLKRLVNIKDFSNLIPGHGGIMDRLDSILISSLVVTILFTLRDFT